MISKSRTGSVQYLSALRRVKTWTRERFALEAGSTVLVTEAACELPGFPPLETVTAFWSAPDIRHEFKVFKPIEDIIEDDLPPAWMKAAMIVELQMGCSCC
jgi:nitrate reductase delta subunit